MQLLNSSVYIEKSNENSIKADIIVPPRGVLYDRNFKYMVSNKPSYTLLITPSDYDTSKNSFLEKVLGIEPGYISKILEKNSKYSDYIPRRIKRDLNFSSVAWLEEHHELINGVNYITELQRDYSYGIKGSHMFGYVKEIDAQQLKKNPDYYSMGDFIGSNGIEKTYEELLRGRKGIKYIVVDAQQRIIGRYENGNEDIRPEKGFDLVITIDSKVQKVAEQAFADKKGALVAIEPSTGEILAFVSSPQYDLSTFASVISGDIWTTLSRDPNKPLFNRATMTRNPPGSTFKMIAAIAALEEGIITTENTYTCSGSFQFGNRSFKCTHVHGTVNVTTAIEKSCNVFFYQLILKIGLDRWSKYAAKFGFGFKSGVDLIEESAGILPSRHYFDNTYGKGKWTDGYLVSLAIGQGDIITTPIQLAKYCALLAGEGHSYQPHFLKGYIDNRSNEFIAKDFEKIELDISKRTMDIVREGMRRVVNGSGTATWIREKDFEIAGKTGTAQNPHGDDHAIFIGFAPYDNPKIAVSVLVENVGFGSTHAAPIARDVIKAYLANKIIAKSKNLVSLDK